MGREINILLMKLFAPTGPVKVEIVNLMGQDNVALKNKAKEKNVIGIELYRDSKG